MFLHGSLKVMNIILVSLTEGWLKVAWSLKILLAQTRYTSFMNHCFRNYLVRY